MRINGPPPQGHQQNQPGHQQQNIGHNSENQYNQQVSLNNNKNFLYVQFLRVS